MNAYNLLAEANERDNGCKTDWCFKVKILRAYSYSVLNVGPYWSYVLVDEAGTKMELMITPEHVPAFSGLEKYEGHWIEIQNVAVQPGFVAFRATNSHFKLTIQSIQSIQYRKTGIRIIDPLNDEHYLDFLSLTQIRDIKTKTNVAIDTMGMLCNTCPLQESPLGRTFSKSVFHIKVAMDNMLKCVATGEHAYNFWNGFRNRRGGAVIVVLKLWRINQFARGDDDTWLETEEGLSDILFDPAMEEVEDLRDDFLMFDMIARYRAIVPR